MEKTGKPANRPRKFTPEQVAKAGTDAGGRVSEAARHLMSSRTLVNRYIKQHPMVQQALMDERERRNDIVEDKLFQLAAEGNLVACIFWAKTRMRDRGFIERDKLDYREVLMALGQDPDKVLSKHAEEINNKPSRAIAAAPEDIVQRV